MVFPAEASSEGGETVLAGEVPGNLSGLRRRQLGQLLARQEAVQSPIDVSLVSDSDWSALSHRHADSPAIES